MTGFKGVRLSGLSRFYHGFVFLNFAIKLCNPLHIDPYLDDIRAIQDFEAMKLFNEYSMLENPESKLYMEDPLVQDESNVIGKKKNKNGQNCKQTGQLKTYTFLILLQRFVWLLLTGF